MGLAATEYAGVYSTCNARKWLYLSLQLSHQAPDSIFVILAIIGFGWNDKPDTGTQSLASIARLLFDELLSCGFGQEHEAIDKSLP